MKGDFTRSTFRREKHYSSVRMQQGRVQLDSDWNEQMDIAAHRVETESRDVIGHCGGPLDGAGFALSNGADPTLSAGRYYVDGILCENEGPTPLGSQPDLPGVGLPAAAGSYLAYLDVWQRHITALEDGDIREVALGGPDTATRSRTVWQVRLLGPLGGALNCASEPAEWQALIAAKTARLAARAQPAEDTENDCIVPPGAGFRRLENQLYRVEVHQGSRNPDGTPATPTFKWSRDNGSIVTQWLDKQSDDLIVSSIGRDQVLRFSANQWVELTDDTRDLLGRPGTLVRLLNAEGSALTIDPATATGSVERADFGNNPKIRRWDHVGTPAQPLTGGAVPIGEGTGESGWIALEEGVEVQFQPGGSYVTGDHWLIPARTATADVDWPFTEPQPPAGIDHHFCKLATATLADGGDWAFQDCRNLFPPLTGLVTLHYVGGDGQEGTANVALAHPLQVRVANGATPVVGAQVRFTVTAGGGAVSAAVVTTTGPHGLAAVSWTLGGSGPQRVEAALLDAAGQPAPGQLVRFQADFEEAGGGCCISVGPGGQFPRLDEALKALLGEGRRDICLCLMPGDQECGPIDIAVERGEPPLHIHIHGAGQASRIMLTERWRLQGVTSFVLEDALLQIPFLAEGNEGMIAFLRCSEVIFAGCHIYGWVQSDGEHPIGTVIFVRGADHTRFENNVIEAALRFSFDIARLIFERAAAPASLVETFALAGKGELRWEAFMELAGKAAEELAALNEDERNRLSESITGIMGEVNQEAGMSLAEVFSFQKLSFGILRGSPPDRLVGLITDVRRNAVKRRPGVALVIEGLRRLDEEELPGLAQFVDALDEDDFTQLVGNEFAGVVGLYGIPRSRDEIIAVMEDIRNKLLPQETRWPNNVVNIPFAFMGTLQMRGNQLVRVAVGGEFMEAIREAALAEGRLPIPDLFSRSVWEANVIEDGGNLVAVSMLTLADNIFTMMAFPTSQREFRWAGFFLSQQAVILGNQATGGREIGPRLADLSRDSEVVANLGLIVET